MAIALTETALSAIQETAKEPILVLKIEGIDRIFGAQLVEKFVRIGDEGLEVGDPSLDPDAFLIGGTGFVKNQDNIITLDGTSTSIKQTLNVDKAEGSTISSVSVALLDSGYATRLITPGEIVPDILMRSAKLYLGFKGTSWPDDYITVFRGLVTDVTADPGKVTLQLNHADDKKRTNIFKSVETKLLSDVTADTTVIPLANTTNFLRKKAYPPGIYDPSFSSYVRIDDEILKYEDIDQDGNLVGVERAKFGTVAAPHKADATANSYYRLQGNGVEIALKVLLSGSKLLPVDSEILPLESHQNLKVTSINFGFSGRFESALFFSGINVFEEYGIISGDYLHSLSGSAFAENNVSYKRITEIISTETGDFVVVEGVNFLDEESTTLRASFVSQFATLPDGCRFAPDEVDVSEHLRLYRLFLNSVEYDFYIKTGIENAKDWLEKEVYAPMGAFSVPRKAQASIGYHIGPIPGQDIVTFDQSNVKTPSRIQLKRSSSRNFWNEIVYKYDQDPLDDKFLTGYLVISESSKNRIKNAPNRTLTIEAKGMRTLLSGDNIALIHGRRRLKRYEFGAETILFDAFFDSSFPIEIGDIIIFDGTQLAIPDIKTGQKGMAPRFFEVVNKDLQLKTGTVRLEIIDTAFDGSGRYGLISPSSIIKDGVSTTSFVLQPSYSSRLGNNEFRKWSALKKCAVRVRNSDFSLSTDTVIRSATSNLITVDELPFVPTAGMILELSNYALPSVTDQVKLIYAHMKNSEFADGRLQYSML